MSDRKEYIKKWQAKRTRISFYLTAEETAIVERKAQKFHLKRNELVRHLALHSSPSPEEEEKRREYKKSLEECKKLLMGVSSNIHKITFTATENALSGNALNDVELEVLLEKVHTELKSLQQQIIEKYLLEK